MLKIELQLLFLIAEMLLGMVRHDPFFTQEQKNDYTRRLRDMENNREVKDVIS